MLSNDPLPSDSIAVAVLVLDYQTYSFVGGNLTFYPSCTGCGADRLPVEMDYRPPGDFGSISFNLEESGLSIFAASIIWMGTGAISYPEEFLPPSSYKRTGLSLPYPDDPEYLGPYPSQVDDTYRDATRAAWDEISSLDIVKRFAEIPHKVGFYLYPPTVGLFDPGKARWIVFLYAPGERSF